MLAELLAFIGVARPAPAPGEAVRNMNHKFRERMPPALLRELTEALAPTLAIHGYDTVSA
jgi:hypothetical protein